MKNFEKENNFVSNTESRRSFIKKTGSLIALASLAGPIDILGNANNVPQNIKTKGYAARVENGILSSYDFERRTLQDDDVQVKILYCGVCHSDIHTVRGHWGPAHYPLVPGHEMTGCVVAVGKNVTRFKVGDRAGVGTVVDSCGTCHSCKEGQEQYCDNRPTFTYNSPDKILGGYTQGGYSKTIIVKEHFVFNIPDNMDLSAAAPLLCAGITTYAPIIKWKVREGMRVGVAGIGGLGHIAIKLAALKGADITAFTTSPSKIDDIKRFGASKVVVVDDVKVLRDHIGTMDFLISTIPQKYNLSRYVRVVKRNGVFSQVGLPGGSYSINSMVLMSSVNITGSMVGGVAETQEMINYCAKNNIAPEVSMIDIKDINNAFDKVVNKEARYRYVIDMSKFV
jgi:alcohol dehydrogenase (NADP+)/uncharacterized zinc-type alcohol dehydrogenase-like protein